MGVNKRKTGAEYENFAVEYLKKHGYEIICTNFYCKMGEIDIIARNEGYLVFAEVKYRKNLSYGYPQEAVSVSKQKKIIKTAHYFCLKNKISQEEAVRFDVVAITGKEISLIKNAFDINCISN